MMKTKAKDNTSPKEKEKLRKRLQALFKQEENAKKDFAGHSKNMNKKGKTMQDSQQFKGQQSKGQQFKTNNNLADPSKSPKAKNIKMSQKNKSGDTLKEKNSKIMSGTNSKEKNIAPNKSQTFPQGPQNVTNPKKKKNKSKGLKNSPEIPNTNHSNADQNPKSKNSPGIPKHKHLNSNMDLKQKNVSEIPKSNHSNISKSQKPKNSPEISQTVPQKKQNKQQKKKMQHNLNTQPFKIEETTSKPVSSNNQQKLSKNQKKKAKKRAAAAPALNSQPKNKKAKFSEKRKEIKNGKKQKDSPAQKKKTTPSAQNDDEYDISNMTGFVQGGDFHSYDDFMDQQYWKQNDVRNNDGESNESNFDSDEEEEDDDYDTDDIPPYVEKKYSRDMESNESNFDSDEEDDYDTDDIPPYVEKKNGRDQESNESNFDSDEESDYDSDMIPPYVEENNGRDMEKMGNHGKYHGSEDYFESDEFETCSDSEEEEENYSDFDENDYEEDEDSYNYSMDDDDYSSDYDSDDEEDLHGGMSYNFEHDDNDGDYNLPNHVLEDLIIHRGTATKRDIRPEDNVSFNSDNEEAQVIELEEQQVIKVITQPEAYKKEELLKLKFRETTTIITLPAGEAKATKSKKTVQSDSEDCPKLVPIVDEDGFQLYNPNDDEEEEEEEQDYENYDDDSMNYEEQSIVDSMDDVSLGSEYEEINSDDADEDADSFLSDDINEKYLNRQDDGESSDDSVNPSVWIKQQKVDVIDATRCKYVGKKVKKSKGDSDESLNDDIQQLPSQKLYENVNLESKGSITEYQLSTIREDKEISEAEEENVKSQSEKVSLDKDLSKTNNTSSESLLPFENMEDLSLDNSELSESTSNLTKQSDKISKVTGQSLLNYNTKFYNALDSNLVLVLLKDPFYIYGTVRLTLLAGSLDIYGYSISPNNEVEIFSPRGCSVIEIAASKGNRTISKSPDIKDLLKTYESNFALADLKTISDLYDADKDAVVLLKRNEGRKKIVQQFKKFMNENVFPNINNINMDRPLYNSEYLLRCMINTTAGEQKCLRLPNQWQQLSVTEKSRVMLTGGKGVGKSTLLRFLINRHLPKLKQILLIDLDIGQPEIFVPQTVSCCVIKQPLLGPGFLLNLQPEKAYAVGHTNIALCAHKYLEAVRSLISHCLAQDQYQNMTWLINTMGYNKGFGLELISVIAKDLPLNDVIQLQSSKEINNFDSILFPHVVSKVPRNMFIEEESSNEDSSELNYRLHVWQSAVQQESRYLKEWDMSAKDLRFATLLARLSDALQGHAEWLTDCKPLSAPLNQLKLVNLMENTSEVSQEELAKAIEANLVYLCNYKDSSNSVECLGIGVVRGIDFHVQQLYLLPAMPISLMKHVNCLAIGEMPLPTSLFTNQGSIVKNLAPFVYDTVAAKASKAIKQIYHRPRAFQTGKHKPLE